MKKIPLVISLIFLLAFFVNAATIPKIDSYVSDKSGVLSSQSKSELESALRDLEKVTNGVQYVVYIENEYPKEYSLEEYTLKIAESNKIGKKGNDNGILLYVAVKDRVYRWEVGYGVEGTLSALLLGRISRDHILPNFKEGNYEKGILETTDIAGRILLGSNDADIVKLKEEAQPKTIFGNKYAVFFMIIMIFAFIILFAYLSSKPSKRVYGGSHKNDVYTGAANALFWGSMGRNFGRGSGGFGGFSGGGGHFGGGGFSGRF